MNYIFLLFVIIFALTGCANDITVNRDLAKIPQNNLNFITNDTANTKYQDTAKLSVNYLEHYFSAWRQNFSGAKQKDILAIEQKQIAAFSKFPGFGANAQRYDATWMLKIAHTMNLEAYPNLKMRAIITRDSALRLLPTIDPSYSDWYKAGQGYPFDNLQISMLNVNTPVYVLHESSNGEWVLVITPYKSVGWVKTLDIGYINNTYIKKWMTKNQVVAIFDKQPLFDQYMRFYTSSRIGQLFPLYKTTKSYYQVIMPLRNHDGYALPKIVNIRKTKARLWPIAISKKNIANLANNMLAQTYGWGELNNYRDCSSAMQALFAPFAIWLPRNSKNQVMSAGKFIDLSRYNKQQKLNIIITKGDPFLTLLWAPGHIVLYIGVKDGRAYIFHNLWGLKTKNYFSAETGRAIVGRAAITPLDFGANYLNVDKTFLARIEGMAMLGAHMGAPLRKRYVATIGK